VYVYISPIVVVVVVQIPPKANVPSCISISSRFIPAATSTTIDRNREWWMSFLSLFPHPALMKPFPFLLHQIETSVDERESVISLCDHSIVK